MAPDRPRKAFTKAKKAILAARKSGPLALSAISLWEIAWLAENKRINSDVSVDSFIKNARLMYRFSQSLRRLRFVLFNSHPSDPQDRIIGATAIVEGICLLTHDKLIARSGLVPLVQ